MTTKGATPVRRETTFTCQHCGQHINTTYPSGEPVISRHFTRYFHVTRPDGTWTMEPAGNWEVLVCLSCDTKIEQVVANLMHGAKGTP